MKSRLLLVGILGASSLAQALTEIGNLTLRAPYTSDEVVNVAGDLLLAVPGTYSARGWNVTGEIRLVVAGNFVLSGRDMLIGGATRGSVPGDSRLTLQYSVSLRLFSRTVENATLIPMQLGGGPLDPFIYFQEPLPLPGAKSNVPLLNLSTRATLVEGQTISIGFVVGGTTSRRVLVRAVGPTLTEFGVAGGMPNPTLALFKGRAQQGVNDDWPTVGNLREFFSAVGAFALPPFSHDAAMLAQLAPGDYTLQVRGANASDVGEILAEIYLVD